MSIAILLDDSPSTVRILERRPALRVSVDDRIYRVNERPSAGDGSIEFELDGRVVRAWRYVTPDATYVRVNGRTHMVRRPRRDPESAGAERVEREIRSQMPGTVVEIHCVEGAVVAVGDKLVTTESMKLQYTHVAAGDAVVERIVCQQDTSFETGAVLILLAASDPVARPVAPRETP